MQTSVADLRSRSVSVRAASRREGLSLAPDHPQYQGKYGGNQYQRDGAYHQGTVWGWLLGSFALARLRVYKNPDKLVNFCNQWLII